MIAAPVEPAALLTTEQAAAYLGIGESTLFRMIQAGQIPAVKLNRRQTRIRRTDLNAYIDQLPSTA